MTAFELQTARLRLRSWRDEDVEPFLVVNSDPEVMATLGPVMDRDAVAALIARMRQREADFGMTFWAMERRADDLLLGWCGVSRGSTGPIDGKPEIGWRMRRDCWGHGYVGEAATATLDWLFAHYEDDAAWAITSTGNWRSRAVMERLGMTHRPDLDFAHPSFAPDHPLSAHVAYCLPRENWFK